MRTKILFLAVMLQMAILPSYSQEETGGQKTTAGDNWFISAGTGTNLLIGEQDEKYGSASDRLRLAWELSAGKWFNPNFGMRLQLSIGKLNGFNYIVPHGGEYTRADRSRDPYPLGYYDNSLRLSGDDGFHQDFYHGSAGVDLMANLTHLFRGHYRESLFEFVPFVGLGYMHATKSNTNPTFDNIFFKMGARANFNINKQWAVYLEPQVNFTNKELDGYVGNRDFDGIVKCFLGAQFNINKGFSQASLFSQDEINRLNEKLNLQHEMIENQQQDLERQQQMIQDVNAEMRRVEQAREKEQATQPAFSQGKQFPEYVRFGLNSATVDPMEKHKIESAAAFLKSSPQSKLMLVGYADRQTGKSEYNYQLSCKRVEAVASLLKSLGVDSGRLIVKCVGDKEQIYKQNEWNRVVVITER